MQTKSCFKCHCVKPLSDFYKHKAMPDGTLNKCKECAKADVRANRLLRIDFYRDFDRSRAMLPHRVKARQDYAKTKNGSEKCAKAKAKWSELNPIKRLASHAVNNAVRDGRLAKPESCQSCGKSGRIHGHHCDYAKVFDVMWLCPSCHMKWHKQNGEGINAS